MKTSNFIYATGLILIAVSIGLIVLHSDSGRTQLIAGGLTFIGFPLNIAGFAIKRTKSTMVKHE